MTMAEYKAQVKADAKKIKMFRDMCKEMKVRQDESEKQIEKLVSRNCQLEKEVHDQENKFVELYDEYNMMNDDMHELQQQLEEAGFGDNGSEEGQEQKTSKGNSILNIPGKGGKQIMKILNKSRKLVAKGGKNVI